MTCRGACGWSIVAMSATGLARFTEGGITLPVLTPITTPDKLGQLIEALAPR